ncbi:unnamed protein product [Meganyctiphanes norvegica]|uniref:NADH dehydrogenase subunit 4L n=1 Tax=Meganyctiphanes norvegica TaxID=48144 RepID=A0AAV2SG15_MEGNR
MLLAEVTLVIELVDGILCMVLVEGILLLVLVESSLFFVLFDGIPLLVLVESSLFLVLVDSIPVLVLIESSLFLVLSEGTLAKIKYPLSFMLDFISLVSCELSSEELFMLVDIPPIIRVIRKSAIKKAKQ